MYMKHKIFPGIVFCVAFLLMTESAYSFKRIVSSPKGTPKVAQSSNIIVGPTQSGIQIKAKDASLVDVLQQVANHTNIQFKLADHLISKRVNINIHEKNWQLGITNLLRNFSKVTVWDKSSKMENVLVMDLENEGSEAGSPLVPSAQTGDRVAKAQKSKQQEPAPKLSVAKLKQLVKVEPGNAIPAHLFEDQEVRDYLRSMGIRSANDWKEHKKGKIVQHIAKRELIKSLYKEQEKPKVN